MAYGLSKAYACLMGSPAEVAVGEVVGGQHGSDRRGKRCRGDDQGADEFGEVAEQLAVVLDVLLGEEGMHELVAEGLDGQQVAEGQRGAELHGTQGGLVEDDRVSAEAGVQSAA